MSDHPDPRREGVRRLLEAIGALSIRDSPEGFTCRCPFHDGASGYHRSKSPSFSINTTTGQFYCFSGVCRRAGSVRQTLTDLLGYSYSDARAWVDSLGFEPVPDRREVPNIQGRDPSILGLYNRCPTYMLRRGFDKEVLRVWDIGYDRNRRSVTIPVWTPDGKFVGLSRRTTVPDREPKYWHDFEFAARKQVLYGENMVGRVTEANPLIVVEAQFSAIWNYQWEFPNTVATLGCKVSEFQIARIAAYPFVLVALDGDFAGREATQRLLYGWSRTWKGGETVIPGLIQRMERGTLKVVSGWGDHPNKDNEISLAKDPQEVAPENLERLYGSAVPWEVWDHLTGKSLDTLPSGG